MLLRAFCLLSLVALLVAGCGGDDEPTSASESQDTPATEIETSEAETEVAAPGGCDQVKAPAPKPDGGEKPPAKKLAPGKRYAVEIQTNCGAFTIALDQKTSPATAASFAALARKGFFDGTVFHRIVPGFVIQGGDPTGTGTGGPGYSTIDKPPADAAYTKGVVAMAKTGQEAPGTSGSQFYVVTGADAGLPPDYALLGEVTEGLGVVTTIGELGDPATEQPLQPVVIESATVSER